MWYHEIICRVILVITSNILPMLASKFLYMAVSSELIRVAFILIFIFRTLLDFIFLFSSVLIYFDLMCKLNLLLLIWCYALEASFFCFMFFSTMGTSSMLFQFHTLLITSFSLCLFICFPWILLDFFQIAGPFEPTLERERSKVKRVWRIFCNFQSPKTSLFWHFFQYSLRVTC